MSEIVGYDRRRQPLRVGDRVRYLRRNSCPHGKIEEGKDSIVRVVWDEERGDTWLSASDFLKLNLLEEIAEAARDPDDRV